MTEINRQIEQLFTEHKLLGNHDFRDDDYSTMVDAVQKLCQNNTFQKSYNKLIFLTLVEIAKRWKETDNKGNNEENSGFWYFVFKTLTGFDGLNQTLYNQFTSLISEIGQHNQIPIVRTGKKYYATLMMHAFAPKKSIHSFFDLCYNVFKKDLDFSFTSDDEWLCEIVALQITSVLKNGYREDKAISIGSSTYSIKIGLRSFALHDDLSQIFVQFIKDTFEQINKLFNREKFDENTRLKRYIVEWWKNKTENEKSSDGVTRKKRIATVSKQNIAAKYIRDEDEVLLCIPPIRLDNENEIVRLSVYINSEQHYSEEMRTKRGELVVSTKEKEFDLNDLLRHSESINIQVKITENKAILYDSEETLNREFILFEGEKEVLSQINKPSNYFVYSLNIDALKNTPYELTTYSTKLYNIYPRAGETLTGQTKQVLFVDKAKVAQSSNTISLLGNLPDIEWFLDDIHCFVYKDSVKLIVPESTNLKALELKIDNNTYRLDALDNERLENNAYMFGLIKLEVLKPNEPIELSLFSYEKETTVLTETLIVLPELELKFSNEVFYGDIERKITVSDGKQSNDFSWNNQENEINCPLTEGNLLIKIPYLKWRITNKDWHNEPINKKLWYKDFLHNGDLLEIDNPKKEEEIKLFVKIDGQKTEISRNQSGKFEIGRAIYANEGKIEILVYCSNGQENFELFKIATKEHFIENPVSYSDGKVYWNVEDAFIGDKENEFLLDVGGRNVFRNRIENKNKEILSSIKEDIYRVAVKIKDKNIFSRDEKWDTIFEDTLMVGKPEKFRFKNKKIHLLSANCFNNNSFEWFQFIPRYFIDNITYVQEDENDYYSGNLFVIDKNDEIKKLNTMINEKGEYDKINPVRIEIRNSNTLWLVGDYKGANEFLGNLFCDKWRKGICNIQKSDSQFDEINLYKYKEEEDV